MNDSKAQKDFERQYSESMKDSLFALNIDSVKSKYGEKFMELRAIINHHDPIGLINIGAPDDEYDSEVKTIIVQLKSDLTEEQIHDLIYEEFLRWFNNESTTGQKSAYKELTKDIYNWNKQ